MLPLSSRISIGALLKQLYLPPHSHDLGVVGSLLFSFRSDVFIALLNKLSFQVLKQLNNGGRLGLVRSGLGLLLLGEGWGALNK